VLDRFGPPLLSSIVLTLSPWSGQLPPSLTAWDVWLRALLWLIGAVLLLALTFDRRELSRLERR